MPADLPSLERLTADVATAMRAAEQHAAARRGRSWGRRRPGPLAAVLVALLLAASALALHASTGKGAERTLPAPRCDAAQAVTVTVAVAAALSRRGGRPGPAISLRPCA